MFWRRICSEHDLNDSPRRSGGEHGAQPPERDGYPQPEGDEVVQREDWTVDQALQRNRRLGLDPEVRTPLQPSITMEPRMSRWRVPNGDLEVANAGREGG